MTEIVLVVMIVGFAWYDLKRRLDRIEDMMVDEHFEVEEFAIETDDDEE